MGHLARRGSPKRCCHLCGASRDVKPRPSNHPQPLPDVHKNAGHQGTLFLLFPHPEPQPDGRGPS